MTYACMLLAAGAAGIVIGIRIPDLYRVPRRRAPWVRRAMPSRAVLIVYGESTAEAAERLAAGVTSWSVPESDGGVDNDAAAY